MDELTLERKRMLIDADHPELTIHRQCELLGLARSCWYYARKASAEESYNQRLMRLIDVQYTARPFFGARDR